MKRVAGIIAVVVLLLGQSPAPANDYTFTENFTSTEFRDGVYTTAWWDTLTGTLVPYPFELTVLGNYDTPGLAHGVATDGDLALVADVTAGLRVIDITDLSNPAADDGTFGLPPLPPGRYLLRAAGEAGESTIDVTLPAGGLLRVVVFPRD